MFNNNNNRVIVALSGGKASAMCAKLTLEKYPKDKVILYFNDTRWEHPDLYRFLKDLSNYFNHEIIIDSDGRTPEELFYDMRFLGCNRVPLCSRVLKAERLQKFRQNGDILVFGIGKEEEHRAIRLTQRYQLVGVKTNIFNTLEFPLIENNISNSDVTNFFNSTGIELPKLYQLGFKHNNCSGGCVRAGKKNWKLLFEKLPDVYIDRERVEREFRAWIKKDVSFFKDETLESFRKKIENNELSSYYNTPDDEPFECVGVCDTLA